MCSSLVLNFESSMYKKIMRWTCSYWNLRTLVDDWTPARICLLLIKAYWTCETTILPMTRCSLLVRTFANTLYMQPTREMGRKWLRCWGLCTFEIRAIKVVLIPFENFLLWWNSDKNRMKSIQSSFQNSFMKPKLMSFGSGLLKLSQSQSAFLTSSKEKGRVSWTASATLI